MGAKKVVGINELVSNYKSAKKTIMNKDPRKLIETVYLMIVLAIITFLTGFLKYTPFEHISLLLFFLLFLGGVRLFYGANNSEINRISKFSLILTGISTTLFMLLIAYAILMTLLSDVSLSDNLESLESLFYLSSLLFLIGALGCIIFLNIKGGRKST